MKASKLRKLVHNYLPQVCILILCFSFSALASQRDSITEREPFKSNFAISLYAATQSKMAAEDEKQILDKALVRQKARDYISAWNTRDIDGIRAKLIPVLSTQATYSDPGETAYGIDEVAATAAQMHRNLKGLVRVFEIAGEPELIEHTSSVFYNVKNLLVYNWDWQQDGKSVLHGKEMTIFDDNQMIHYDMGIFATQSFPHFEATAALTLESMNKSIDAYLATLNALSNDEKYQLLAKILSHPASTMNAHHSTLLTKLGATDLTNAKFERSGKPSTTQISMAFPWKLNLGETSLIEGLEVNVFDQTGAIKFAFGFSGN